MTTTDERERLLLRFLIDECGAPEDLARDDALFSSNTLDSLDIVSLVAFIEERFGVRIPALDVGFDKMDTVALVVTLVDQYQTS